MGNNQPKKLSEAKLVSHHPALTDAKIIVDDKNRKYI